MLKGWQLEFMYPTTHPKILIIDDDEQIRNLLKDLLQAEYRCIVAESAEEALNVLERSVFDLIISDISLSGISGLELVRRIRERSPDTVVVMISGQQTIDFAIESMRAGAFDYVTKPLDLRQVEAGVRRALSQHQLLKEKRRYENHVEELVKERTAEIEHLAYHDRLTNLPNRALFEDRCAQALSSAQRNKQLVAVMMVSLDRFKKVTETLGQPAGDVVLTESVSRLQSCVPEGETVARFEGDEFVLLLTQVKETGDLTELCLSIDEAFKQPFRLDRQDVYITVSIGISIFPNNGADAQTILRNADAALSRAKNQGGNNYQFYSTDMNARALRRLALETSLRQAIENEEFVIHYQPVLDLASGELVGSEALVRWQHPEFGLLPPAKFIGLAEDSGLILEISDFVMREACVQTRQWQQPGHERLRVAVNISARHFSHQNFLERLL